jgi:hypothetical protein
MRRRRYDPYSGDSEYPYSNYCPYKQSECQYARSVFERSQYGGSELIDFTCEIGDGAAWSLVLYGSDGFAGERFCPMSVEDIDEYSYNEKRVNLPPITYERILAMMANGVDLIKFFGPIDDPDWADLETLTPEQRTDIKKRYLTRLLND